MLKQEGWSPLNKRRRSGYTALGDEKQPSRLEIMKGMIEQEGWNPLGLYKKKCLTLVNEEVEAFQYARCIERSYAKGGMGSIKRLYEEVFYPLHREARRISVFRLKGDYLESRSEPLGGYNNELLDQYRWTECLEEETKDLQQSLTQVCYFHTSAHFPSVSHNSQTSTIYNNTALFLGATTNTHQHHAPLTSSSNSTPTASSRWAPDTPSLG